MRHCVYSKKLFLIAFKNDKCFEMSSTESDDETVFGGPITARELELRWRRLMIEKVEESLHVKGNDIDSEDKENLLEENMEASRPASHVPEANDVTGFGNDSQNEDKKNIPNEEDLKVSNLLSYVPESSADLIDLRSIEAVDSSEFRLMEDIRKSENKIEPTNQKLVIKPAKFKFDKSNSAENKNWEFKVKKIAAKKPDYMMSPSKVGLYLKNKTFLKARENLSRTTVKTPNKILLEARENLPQETVKTPNKVLLGPPKTPNKYANIQSTIGKYIRNKAIVKDNNKIIPKSDC